MTGKQADSEAPESKPTDDRLTALRHNAGKIKWHLLPFKQLEAIVRVFEMGAEKYAPDNWKLPMPTDEIFNSAQRHMAQIQSGELLDEESGLPHAAHVAVNMLFHLYHADTDYASKKEIR